MDGKALLAAGFAALERDAAAQARERFEQALAAGAQPADGWYGLARVHQHLGEAQGALTALDRALEFDAGHFPSLIAKGDAYAEAGDPRAASAYYLRALELGAGLTDPPPRLRAELQRIAAARDRFAAAFGQRLSESLAAAGLGRPGTERVAHALDLLLGRREIYLQQPRHFYLPELPQKQFHAREDFPWATALEAATDDIRAELQAVLADGEGVAPYIQPAADRPNATSHPLFNNPAWSAFHLIRDGAVVAQNARRCPRTLAALEKVPLCEVAGRTPVAHFSLLRPGAHIAPHHGFMNARLICHLPLIVPAGCGLRVGNETREWREGGLTVFDDSFEHEAWNRSDELRAVLIFDVWRPELTAAERGLVAEMLASIQAYGGPSQAWAD